MNSKYIIQYSPLKDIFLTKSDCNYLFIRSTECIHSNLLELKVNTFFVIKEKFMAPDITTI